MKKLLVTTLSVGILLSASAFSNENIIEAPDKAAICVACHGMGGNSLVPNFPKLAGQHAVYLEKQLKDFRGGFRKDPSMSSFALNLSDKEIEELAKYYASQQSK